MRYPVPLHSQEIISHITAQSVGRLGLILKPPTGLLLDGGVKGSTGPARAGEGV